MNRVKTTFLVACGFLGGGAFGFKLCEKVIIRAIQKEDEKWKAEWPKRRRELEKKHFKSYSGYYGGNNDES